MVAKDWVALGVEAAAELARREAAADQERRTTIRWVERETQAMNDWPRMIEMPDASLSPVDQARRLLAGTGYVVARDVRPTFDGLDAFCDGWNAACEAMKGDAL